LMRKKGVRGSVVSALRLLRDARLLLRGEVEAGEWGDADAIELSQRIAEVTAETLTLRRELASWFLNAGTRWRS